MKGALAPCVVGGIGAAVMILFVPLKPEVDVDEGKAERELSSR